MLVPVRMNLQAYQMSEPGIFDWIIQGALLLALGCWSFVQLRYLIRRHRSQSWPVVDATIQKGAVGRISFGRGGSAPASFMGYAYQVEGLRYAGVFAMYGDETRMLKLHRSLGGSTLQVRYNPADPNISCLADDCDPRFEQLAVTQNPEWLDQAPTFDLQDAIRGTAVRPSSKVSQSTNDNNAVIRIGPTLDSSTIEYGATPKPKFNLAFLLVLLLIPYMIFVQYFALRLPKHALPHWFPIVAACYFLGTLILVTVLHSRRRSR